jgi:hypothetical protein
MDWLDRLEALPPPPETLADRAARAAEHTRKALWHRERAEDTERYDQRHGNPPGGGQFDRNLADLEERKAEALQSPPGPLIRGTGGEVTLAPNPDQPGGIPLAELAFRDTLESPTSTGSAASRARMQQALTLGHDTPAQALDASETLGAANSLEKMAAHQMAAAHSLAMKLLHDGAEMIRQGQQRSDFQGSTFFNVEGNRIIGTAIRLMVAYQSGLATLARVRQGGRQVVTVQHVQVNDGGQAVVAGQVTPEGAPRGEEGAS